MMDSNKKLTDKAKKIGIIIATRIGRYNSDHGRPVCVCFSCHLDVQMIMENKKS